MSEPIICRLSRVFPESALGRRHAGRCPGCRAELAAFAELDQSLRAAAGDGTAPVPTGLERRIAAAVRTSSVGHTENHGRAIFGAFAALAVIALAFLVFRSPVPESAAPAANLAFNRAELRQTAEAISSRVWGTLLSAGALAGNNALRDELGLVRSNARTALRFLEANFVPSSFRSETVQRGNG